MVSTLSSLVADIAQPADTQQYQGKMHRNGTGSNQVPLGNGGHQGRGGGRGYGGRGYGGNRGNGRTNGPMRGGAGAQQGRNGWKGHNTAPSGIQCWNCHRYGHYAAHCPDNITYFEDYDTTYVMDFNYLETDELSPDQIHYSAMEVDESAGANEEVEEVEMGEPSAPGTSAGGSPMDIEPVLTEPVVEEPGEAVPEPEKEEEVPEVKEPEREPEIVPEPVPRFQATLPMPTFPRARAMPDPPDTVSDHTMDPRQVPTPTIKTEEELNVWEGLHETGSFLGEAPQFQPRSAARVQPPGLEPEEEVKVEEREGIGGPSELVRNLNVGHKVWCQRTQSWWFPEVLDFLRKQRMEAADRHEERDDSPLDGEAQSRYQEELRMIDRSAAEMNFSMDGGQGKDTPAEREKQAKDKKARQYFADQLRLAEHHSRFAVEARELAEKRLRNAYVMPSEHAQEIYLRDMAKLREREPEGARLTIGPLPQTGPFH
ncbi:hypothetical protein BSKO_09635 [Bryopsis sp. KO-2023]|nr:hypothetical protein BSKO_09635 [Bryopsis sp. KO-2023]